MIWGAVGFLLLLVAPVYGESRCCVDPRATLGWADEVVAQAPDALDRTTVGQGVVALNTRALVAYGR
jgi:hypothetical protein